MVDLLDSEIRDMDGWGPRAQPIDAPSAFIPAPRLGLGLSDWKELISLMQGKKQGTDNKDIRALYEAFEQELVAAEAEAEAEAEKAKLAATAPQAPNKTVALGTPVTVAQT
jgi:hypothetical protein